MDNVLIPIKEECLNVLRGMSLSEIDKSSIQNDTGHGNSVQIGNGTFCGVYRVRAVEATDTPDQKNRHLLNLEKDIGVKLAAVKSPHAYRIGDYLMAFTSSKVPREQKVRKILRYYSRECDIWARISAKVGNARDNNLLEFYGFLESYEFNALPAFVSKYYALGDVRNYIIQNTQPLLSNKQKLFVISDVAKALAFMHSVCGVAHRDVRGSNILLEARENRLVGVLGDFGSAKEFTLGTPWFISSSSESGNERWSPPEYSCEGGFHNDKGPGDIWSLGCTMLEVLQGADPWYQLPEGDIPARIAAKEPPPKGDKVLKQHYDVMRKCWTKKDERPTALEMHSEIACLAECCNS